MLNWENKKDFEQLHKVIPLEISDKKVNEMEYRKIIEKNQSKYQLKSLLETNQEKREEDKNIQYQERKE